MQSIATGCIQDRLWCVLSLLQKLMDSAADIFPGQKCFVFGVVPNRISNGDLHTQLIEPDCIFCAADLKALAALAILFFDESSICPITTRIMPIPFNTSSHDKRSALLCSALLLSLIHISIRVMEESHLLSGIIVNPNRLTFNAYLRQLIHRLLHTCLLYTSRTRKDSTRFVDTLITASPEFFKGKSPKEIAAYFQRAADFLIDRVGRENIVSAMVHMDEKTPHLHLVFVPLTKDNRLCAKEIIGNRANLTKWQDDFHACMVEQYPDLERGESASKTGRKHIPTRLFKQAVNLSKQARAIEAVLSGITPLNAGKKKEEALSMLKKWFPQMENFSGQLKKYKVTINDLLAENEKLEVRAKASEKGKMNDTMERAKLKSELDDMRRLVDRIPPEILAELKRQQRQHGKER